jgi:hypothetical protein
MVLVMKYLTPRHDRLVGCRNQKKIYKPCKVMPPRLIPEEITRYSCRVVIFIISGSEQFDVVVADIIIIIFIL